MNESTKPRSGRPPSGRSRSTFDAWVQAHQLTSRRVGELCAIAAPLCGLTAEYVPVPKTVDDYRSGRYIPSPPVILLIKHVTGGAIDLEHWVRDIVRRSSEVPMPTIEPPRRGSPPGKAAAAAALVTGKHMVIGADGKRRVITPREAAEQVGCSRQAVDLFLRRERARAKPTATPVIDTDSPTTSKRARRS